jgi:hypothetical protein
MSPLTDMPTTRRSYLRGLARTRGVRSAASVLWRSGLGALAASAIALAAASAASAGTYPMYQCTPGNPAVSPGWSVFGVNTITSSVLWNTCSTGGAIGDSVASNEQVGAVTENGHMGSQVGLQMDVPASAPDVTIQSIAAEVIGSSVTGDDAWLGFTSGGQALPGAVELPYGGGSNYAASESWTLPQGARDFEANVTCSTDDSSPTCYFADSIAVPALSGITVTLTDNTPPAVTSVSGALATAAASKSTVAGSQLLNFTGSDADSGVHSATLTLSPQGGGAPYTHVFDFSSQCSYDSWNACPLTETVSGFAVNTSSLKDDSYAVSVAVTDAAGNTASDSLGTIVSHNAPANTSVPTILVPGQVLVGSALTTQPGAWSAPSGAGTITYGYQWEQCDSQGNNCQQIAGAQNPGYTPAPSDVGHTLRLLVTATDNDGSTVTASTPTSLVLNAAGSLGALPGPGTGGDTGGGASTQPSRVGLGAPNGSAASETAQIRLGDRRVISRSFTHRAFQLSGRLLNAQGQPISGATLDIVQQIAGSGKSRVVTHAKTQANGSFAVRVPAGPSRLIEVAYRAFADDANYAAQATVDESVAASVQLGITPRDTSANGTITLSGRVFGSVPSQGVVVELLVHYHGYWEPFRTPRTDSNGRFTVVYQFEGGVGRFPFRAEVFGGQAAFPFIHGESGAIDVTTN